MLAGAARWLTGLGVSHVAVDATGICSMPGCHARGHGDFGQVLVCNAGHVKNVPGRKPVSPTRTGWCTCWNAGCWAGSFIPPAGIKAARDVFRYRAKVAQQRVSETARLTCNQPPPNPTSGRTRLRQRSTECRRLPS